MSNWTDADRAKQREYLIYVGRRLHKRFRANLNQATDLFNKECDKIEHRTMTLYSDRRSIDEMCVHSGPL